MTPAEILDEIAKLDRKDRKSIAITLMSEEPITPPINLASNEFEHLSKQDAFALLIQEIQELKSDIGDKDWYEMLELMNEEIINHEED